MKHKSCKLQCACTHVTYSSNMAAVSKCYSLFTILRGKAVSLKHSMQILAREVLLVKAISMHVFLCYLEPRKHFSQGDHGEFSYKYSTRETANLVSVLLHNDLIKGND